MNKRSEVIGGSCDRQRAQNRNNPRPSAWINDFRQHQPARLVVASCHRACYALLGSKKLRFEKGVTEHIRNDRNLVRWGSLPTFGGGTLRHQY